MKPFLLAASAALLFPAAAAAEIYQWTDAKGVVHYSDERPAQAPAGLRMRDAREIPVIRTESSGNFRYFESRERTRRQASAGTESARKSRSEGCAQVREDLEQVQARLRSGYGEPEGNRLRTRRRALRDLYADRCR